ncbi:U3 small nucleolar RNA-associated protein 25 [Tanacetum coccineum]
MAKPRANNKRGSKPNVKANMLITKPATHSGTSSEEHSEEHSDLASEDEQEEEVAVYKEPSMYDNLLKTLGSASESIADAYKRRQRAEEGKSDTDEDEEDEEDDLELLSGSDEDEDEAEEGDLDPTDVEDASLAGMKEHSEDDAEESSDTDGGAEYTENPSSIANGSESSSSFSAHLDYKLLKEDIESLSTNKVKYKWEVDAVNCKWVATKEPHLEDSYTSPPYGLNQKVYDHWLNTYKPSGGQDLHSSRQRSFFSLCNSYRDILHHNKKPFYLKGREEDSSIMDGYLLHSLNHVFKTRDIVTKNEKKLAKEKESKTDGILDSESFLDQGFTRPKVLILLPMASIAYRVVNRLIQLTPSGNRATVDHIGRFSDEFGTGRADDQEGEDGIAKTWKTSKPSDFQSLFGGNNNDHFMVGIKFTNALIFNDDVYIFRKTIKLYSYFYTSEMIVPSPLGKADKEKDVDYLSSIEVLLLASYHLSYKSVAQFLKPRMITGEIAISLKAYHGTLKAYFHHH